VHHNGSLSPRKLILDDIMALLPISLFFVSAGTTSFSIHNQKQSTKPDTAIGKI
jgi:hypothetical protein